MESIKHTPLVEKAIEAIRNIIQSGDIKVGEKLPTEKELCLRLNISRSTLREAYRSLQAMGYIELRSSKGAYVFRTSDQDTNNQVIEWFASHEDELLDCFQVREALEPLAVSLDIQRATDSELYEIMGISSLFEQAVNDGNTGSMALFDELFHNKIIGATHNKLLISINERINKTLASYRSKSFAVARNAVNAVKPHREIASALIARDVPRAQKAVYDHLYISRIDIEKTVTATATGGTAK
jgi:GntR family transcriptional regulator, transcriptional repressor for pyruvate dehydrogenase complex